MTKRLIPRHDPDEDAILGRLLSAEQDAALTAVWLDRATARQKRVYADLLDSARQDNRWIACDCGGDEEAQLRRPPVLMIRRQETGSIDVYRPSNRPEHADSCPFRVTQEEHRHRRDRATRQRESAINPDEMPTLLGTDPLRVRVPRKEPALHDLQQPSQTKSDSLFKILAWLIEKSGVNVCSASPLRAMEQWQAIEDLAKRTKLGSTTTLDTLLMRGTAWLLENKYQRAFYAITKKTPPGHRPVAYILMVADQLARRNDGGTDVSTHQWVTVPGQATKQRLTVELVFPGEIRFPASDTDHAKAPFLVLLKVAQSNNGKPRLSRGVAQPIVSSTNLYPVDSDQERKTYLKLIQTGAVHLRKGGFFEVEKPVQGRKTAKGICRPDFLVRRAETHSVADTLVIETMGYSDSEYRLRKLENMALMRLLGDQLYEDDRPPGTDEKMADDQLYRRVMRWLMHGTDAR